MAFSGSDFTFQSGCGQPFDTLFVSDDKILKTKQLLKPEISKTGRI